MNSNGILHFPTRFAYETRFKKKKKNYLYINYEFPYSSLVNINIIPLWIQRRKHEKR